jgi:colanic acid/amylovoran biosynthesis glycosyltransferase
MADRTTKLGYLVPEFPSQTHIFFWREVAALRAQGMQVQLFSTRRPQPDACRHSFSPAAIAETKYLFPPEWMNAIGWLVGHPTRTAKAIGYVLRLNETPWPRRLALLGLLLPAAELSRFASAHGVNHVHVHSCANAAHLAALARLMGGPTYSLTLHGDLVAYGTDHRSKVRDASFVAAVTRPLQEQLRTQVMLPAGKTPLLWMGVETSRFVDSGLRQTVEGQLTVLTVARLNVTKGHVYALEAVRRVLDRGIDVRYLIAGEGPERERIEVEIRRLALGEHVELLGTRSEDEVLALLRRADVFVLPSFSYGEAAPVSVMEAMSCGLPVICSIIGGTAEMIDDGVNGFLVAQKDVDAIADRIERLGRDGGLRVRIGREARARAEQTFDAGILAQRFSSLLQRQDADRSKSC